MFAPRSRRRRWFVWAAGSGLLIGAGRMLQGGHFLSDVMFAGWFMWVITALVREAWLWVVRWRRGRPRVRGVRPEAEQAAAVSSS